MSAACVEMGGTASSGGHDGATVVVDIRELLARVTTAVNHALPGLVVTLSSGTTVVPDDGTDPGGLYRLADERLYRSKRA